MALVVEDGTGLSTADSYQSIADVGTYNTAHRASTSWSGATDANKEKYCRLATQWLDANYGPRWKGVKADEDQALNWPRTDAYDNDGYAIDDDALPTRLTDAHSEVAVFLSEGENMFQNFSNPGVIKRKRKKLGPMEEEIEYMGGSSQVKEFPIIEMLLRDLINPSGSIIRG